MNEEINVEITSRGAVAIVSFKAVSISNTQGIAAAAKHINEYIEENYPDRIVMDFEQVKFFSSQVLGILLDIRSKLKACGGEVVISAIDPQLHRVFKITNLDTIFRFFSDKESAAAALNSE